MRTQLLSFPELKLVPVRIYPDNRGYFFEAFRDEWGINSFTQDNISLSYKNVVRGLHYQLRRPQAKFVKVLMGEGLDVVVDIRRDSPTFGKHVAIALTEDGPALYVPVGFAHGIVATSHLMLLLFKCSDVYVPQLATGIRWNDPALAIDWHIPEKDAIVSDKDKENPLLKDAELD